MVKSTPVWWVTVEGLVLPAPVAGQPGLELANTWAGWATDGTPLAPTDRAERDYLRTPAHLDVLARDRGLLDPGAPASDEGALAAARTLRPAVHRAARGLARADDLALLGSLATEGRTHQQLVDTGDGVAWRCAGDAGPRTALLAFALATAALVTGDDARRVRACGGHECGWLFLDTSGRRRWCRMEVCGNRSKQAAFQARRT
ncbi:CGNR zinc finger domain-containing protein [Rhodococcus aerolatus]